MCLAPSLFKVKVRREDPACKGEWLSNRGGCPRKMLYFLMSTTNLQKQADTEAVSCNQINTCQMLSGLPLWTARTCHLPIPGFMPRFRKDSVEEGTESTSYIVHKVFFPLIKKKNYVFKFTACLRYYISPEYFLLGMTLIFFFFFFLSTKRKITLILCLTAYLDQALWRARGWGSFGFHYHWLAV